jgi:hypothetical protein
MKKIILIGIKDKMILKLKEHCTYIFEENINICANQIQNTKEEPSKGHTSQVDGHINRREILKITNGRQEG